MMESIMACLLANMKVETRINQARADSLNEMTAMLEAKADANLREMKAEIETIRENITYGHEEMKSQMSSLTSWIDVSQNRGQ
jgi:LPS O-antigen subunit length determinant protein (WzzB/FepE family)